MGLCASSPDDKARKEEAAAARQLDKALQKQYHQEAQITKLLLLGAGESGKSTIFKQIKNEYGTGVSEDERRGYKQIIYENIIQSISTLVEQTHLLPEKHPELKLGDIAVDENFREEFDGVLTPEMAERIKALWASDGIQAVYKHRSKYQLTDSTKYFLDDIDRIVAPGWVPVDQDIFRSRVRTTGIVQMEFAMDNTRMRMFDVGGQRNERKKWIHCFEGVTALLFVAAMSEFDCVLFEDETTNRLDEALNLFGEMTKSQWFRKSSIILFLNKSDLFKEKIRELPVSSYSEEAWEEFCKHNEGANPQDYDDASDFIQELFVSNHGGNINNLYVHKTCATDTNNVKVVFNAVKDTIIKKSLAEGGLIQF